MADTKKEHYVPRCYLRNFATAEERIQVFDKHKMQVREKQNILDVAMENHFYDIDFDELKKKAGPDAQERIDKELKEILKTDDVDRTIQELGGTKHIEKKFFSPLESVYGQLLQRIIDKSYSGNTWVMKNCLAFSPEEKELLSFFIAVQFIRTKSFRETIGSTFEQAVQTLVYKSQLGDEDEVSREAFAVSLDKDFVKLQHSEMILNPELALDFAQTFQEHIWVMYVNKTDTPFYTSDDPIVNIPHKYDKFRSYAGLKSEGIEVLFPISSDLLLGMYDAQVYSGMFHDRMFFPADVKYVEYFNSAQVIHSQRCVFSRTADFSLAEKVCNEKPDCREFKPRIEVL